MLSYGVYKIIHILGVSMILIAFGGILLHQIKNPKGTSIPQRRLVMITHGIGMLLALLGGFGLLARLGIASSWPLWVWLKLVIWLLLGGGVAIVVRKPHWAKFNWFLLMAIVAFATYLANFHPGGTP